MRGAVLLVILYLFLLSIKLMGMSFKLFGMDFAVGLFELTSNPLAGLFVGIRATSMIQSSSTTTSLIVGLVAGGLIDISAAIPIIMGANVGTSVTNTIVSLSHKKQDKEFKKAFSTAFVHDIFNILTLIVLFPLELLFSPIEKIALFFTSIFVGTTTTSFTSSLTLIINPVAKYLEIAIFEKIHILW